MQRTRALAGAGILAAVLLTGGCSKIADKAAEKATEKAIESKTGDKVDINGGKVKVKDGNGNTVEIDKNGVKTSGKDGSSSATYGDGATLPEGFPDELAPPKGTKLTASSTQTSSTGGKQFYVMGQLDGKVKDVYDGLKSQLTDAGYTIDTDNFLNSSTGDLGTLAASNKKYKVNASVIANTDSAGGTVVTMTVEPQSGE